MSNSLVFILNSSFRLLCDQQTLSVEIFEKIIVSTADIRHKHSSA